MSRRRHALLGLLLFALYLGAPVLHTLDHAHCRTHTDRTTPFDGSLHLTTPADAHHAADCPLCQLLLHAPPMVISRAETMATSAFQIEAAVSRRELLLAARPSVCWTGPRGPPAA